MPVTYKKIASVTVTSATQASLEFTSIPSTYTDLVIFVSGRSAVSAVNDNMQLRFNGSSSGYSDRTLFGSGSGSPGSNTSPLGTSVLYIGSGVPGATATASTFGNVYLYIPNYAGSTNKSVSVDDVAENNATTAHASIVAGIWSNTAAITSIAISNSNNSFVQYTTATLYGISNS